MNAKLKNVYRTVWEHLLFFAPFFLATLIFHRTSPCDLTFDFIAWQHSDGNVNVLMGIMSVRSSDSLTVSKRLQLLYYQTFPTSGWPTLLHLNVVTVLQYFDRNPSKSALNTIRFGQFFVFFSTSVTGKLENDTR